MNNDLISHTVSNAKYVDVIPTFEHFEERNDECGECPFYDNECSGDFDKRCLSADVLELLKRGCNLEMGAAPVRHGQWVEKTKLIHRIPDYRYDCSECSYSVWSPRDRTSYCPNCGAKMDGGVE